MAKTRAQKESQVAELVAGLKGAKTVVFADLSRLKVNDASAFRRKAEKEEVRIFAAKKSLLKIALQEAGCELGADPKAFGGSIAMLCGTGDEIAPAKLFASLKKEKDEVVAFGGILEAKWVSDAEVASLAKLPSKQELIARAVGAIRAPLSGLVGVLQGNIRGLVQVLASIEKSKA